MCVFYHQRRNVQGESVNSRRYLSHADWFRVLFHRITDIRLCVKGRICEESIGIHIVNVSQCLLYSLRPDCTAIKLVEFGASKILQCANSAQLFIVLGRLESP